MSENVGISDVELIRRIRQRDENALSELYTRYIGIVYDLAFFVLRNSAIAEEVTQDAFLKVWNQSHNWDPARGSLATWLLTITRYTAIDRLRAENRRPLWGALDLDELLNVIGNGGGVDDPAWQDRQIVDAMLRDLPPEQMEVIELGFYKGMSHTEIAEALKLPLGTVKGRMRAALQKLRDLYPHRDQ